LGSEDPLDCPWGAATILMLVNAATKVAQVDRARISVVALGVSDTAVLNWPVVTVIKRRTQLVGAWVTVIAIGRYITAPGDLRVYTLVGVRLANGLCTRLSIVTALLRGEAAARDREVIADLRPYRAAVGGTGVAIVTRVGCAGAEVWIRRVLTEVDL